MPTEWIWSDSSETLTLHELSLCCGLTDADLNELMDYSALAPLAPVAPLVSDATVCAFSSEWIAPLRVASRLRVDFDLEVFAIAIVLGHLNRIETLEREVLSLKARLRPAQQSQSVGLE